MPDMSLFRIVVRLSALSDRRLMTAAITLIGVVGFLDVITGPYVSINVGYLIPVFVAAASGRRASFAIALIGAVTWSYIEVQTHSGSFTSDLIPAWNVAARFAVLYMVATLVTTLTGKLARERGLSRTDPLTGLPNARAFDETTAVEIARMRATGGVLTAAYVDVDDFKAVNDTYGHAGGDEVLILAGRTMTGALRSTDVVARLGGDEFALLIPGSGVDDARQRLRAVHEALTAATGAHRQAVGFSIGAVTFTEPPASREELLARADAVMYEVKQQGKNTVLVEAAVSMA
jgi:diguanylate cyclase (GGDEF)-like protein